MEGVLLVEPVKKPFSLLAMVVVCLSVGGCQPASTGRVEGIVTLDGQPVDGALVFAVPERGLGAKAKTDKNGRFSLRETGASRDGLSVGVHKIGVSKVDPSASVAEDQEPTQLLPAKYADHVTSGLSVEVVAGEVKQFDIELRSR